MTLENNDDRWIAKANDPINEKDAPKPLYTSFGLGVDNGRSTRCFQGWSQKGYNHFKELYKLVKEDHAKPSRNKFEESLKESCAQDYAQKPKYKKVSSFVEDGGEEYLPHEMETVGNRAELYGSEDSSDDDEDKGGNIYFMSLLHSGPLRESTQPWRRYHI